MRHVTIVIIYILLTAFIVEDNHQSKSETTATEILQKLSEKLNSYSTISYNYYRNINYFSENYHSETKGTIFLDFQNIDTILGFKFQLEDNQSKIIYNGAESFHLDKKEKKIEINEKPILNNFSSLSFFFNSVVTLKNVLPVIISDKEVVKTLADTTIDNKRFYLLSFVLYNKTINGLGTFTNTTVKLNFLYQLIIDKETFLPYQILQSNSVEPKDYTATIFTNIKGNSESPSELSWYYSTYLSDYKPMVKKDAQQPIAVGSIAPNWTLPVYDKNKNITLSSLKGNVVFLDFWIKNCGPCIASVPDLNAVKEKFKKTKFKILSINSYDPEKDIILFCNKYKTTYEVLMNGKDVAEKYGVNAYPTIVLLDKHGKVLYSGSGFDKLKIEEVIRQSL